MNKKPVSPEVSDALDRLGQYLTRDIEPQSIALELRRSAYHLSMLSLKAADTPDPAPTAVIQSCVYHLNVLAEEIDPLYEQIGGL